MIHLKLTLDLIQGQFKSHGSLKRLFALNVISRAFQGGPQLPASVSVTPKVYFIANKTRKIFNHTYSAWNNGQFLNLIWYFLQFGLRKDPQKWAEEVKTQTTSKDGTV